MLYHLCSLLLIFHIFHLSYGLLDPSLPWYKCDSTSTYAPDSIFSANLEIALSTLQNDTAATGFSTTTISATNSSQQSVTALALCRATFTPSDCQTCINSAAAKIRGRCHNQTSGQIWIDYCTIRYSSKNFINKTTDFSEFWIIDEGDFGDILPTNYIITVKLLMQHLSLLAGKSDKLYAVAKTQVSRHLSVYGYADCTRDIDGESCTKHLLAAIGNLAGCCLGHQSNWVATSTCSFQFSTNPVYKDWETAPDVTVALGVAASPGMEPEAPPSNRGKVKIIIGVICGGLGGVIFMTGVLWILKIKGERVPSLSEDAQKKGIKMKSSLLDLDVLIAATAKFSDENLLGKGGFGTVYKGRMPDGAKIAVKKLAADSKQGREEFENEVRVLLKMQHRNLVQLLGCCIQGEERMLVYEYLPNKSLDKFLFDKSKSGFLDWPKRLNIIMGVARGLVYLHEDSVLKIVHRDIKASNILLDHQMNPKISDFGLAKLFKDEVSYSRSPKIAGTFGYMAPEYVVRGFLSVKSDVFSFGVLMLEIISGRKNHDLLLDEEREELLNFAWRLEEEGRLIELVDETMGSFPKEIVLRCMKIALLCTQESIRDRLTISSAFSMLSNHSITLPPVADRSSRDDTVDCKSNHFSTGCNYITTSFSSFGR